MFVIATVCAPNLPGELHRLDRVAGLPRLRDTDHEGLGVEHGVPVDPFGRDVVLDGDPRPLFDRVARAHRGVVARPGREDHDPTQLAELAVVHPEAFELELALAKPVTDGLRDRVRLLVDLLQHERLVAGLLCALEVPVELDDVVLDRRPVLCAQEP